MCFRLLNIFFNIKSQKISFIQSKYFRSIKSIFLIFGQFFFVFRLIKTCPTDQSDSFKQSLFDLTETGGRFYTNLNRTTTFPNSSKAHYLNFLLNQPLLY